MSCAAVAPPPPLARHHLHRCCFALLCGWHGSGRGTTVRPTTTPTLHRPSFVCRASFSRDALRTLWHVLSDPQSGVSQQIDSAAQEVLCQMHAEQLLAEAQHTDGGNKQGPP